MVDKSVDREGNDIIERTLSHRGLIPFIIVAHMSQNDSW
ncbi:hypothetical protein IC006_2403 [Sulfuracidifex tepidarius]|uniref:Uncharacterized protein n=1 Tax=Sulfuracidifex tepidarius TaxID=1294262 RepID=A0A510DYP0_9CREN|nr:hypothetical protein IC006_2403 [Sulfuracidifex tepidarius]